MLSLDELRHALGRPDMPDAEAQELCDDLVAWLTSVLDAYFDDARAVRAEENRNTSEGDSLHP